MEGRRPRRGPCWFLKFRIRRTVGRLYGFSSCRTKTFPPRSSSRINSGRFVADRLYVFDVRSRIHARISLRARLAAQLQHARPETSQEHTVVRDENHGAFEILELLDEHLFGGEVEVIGGLV